MEITSLIAQHIIDVHEGGNWTDNSIREALENVSVSQATTITAASTNTIAGIIHHLTYWNNVMVIRISGHAVEIPEINGFDVPLLTTEEEWKILQLNNLKSAHDLVDAILKFDNNLSDPILPGYDSAYKSFYGCIEHIYYHLGQITMIKRLT
jgi:hypothetical protein